MVKIDKVSEMFGEVKATLKHIGEDVKEVKEHLKQLNGSVAKNTQFRVAFESTMKITHKFYMGLVTGISVLFTLINYFMR